MAPRRPTGLGAWSQRLEEQVGESAATIALGLGGRATGSCVRVWSRSTQAAKRAGGAGGWRWRAALLLCVSRSFACVSACALSLSEKLT